MIFERIHVILSLSLIASSAVLHLQGSEYFSVPNDLLSAEGNDASRLPFAYVGPVRYQQVFAASQFSRVPQGGAYLTTIFFRRNCASSNSWTVTNLQVNLSTTLKDPDQMDPIFSENIGDDEIAAFGPRDYFPPPLNGSSCPNTQPFANSIRLDKPFFYDPARGNLLLDIRQHDISYRFDTNWPPNLPRPRPEDSLLDAETVVGDSVSRIAAFSLTTDTAEVIETTGLVTSFVFHPIPALTNSVSTNEVVITWATEPRTFALQWTDRLGSNTIWQPYTNSIGGGALYRMVTIPRESLTSSMYFRLAWEDGPAIPQSGGSTNSPLP